MRLSDIIAESSVDIDLRVEDKPEVFTALGRLLADALPAADPGEIAGILSERERLATTGVGDGVAIPHGKMPGLDRIVGALGMVREGLPFDAIDDRPVTVFVALLGPPDATADHLKALTRVSRLLKTPGFCERLLGSTSAAQALGIVAEEDSRH